MYVQYIAIQSTNEVDFTLYKIKLLLLLLLFLALVDANYKFLYVDVGASGRTGDTGMFAASSLKGS